jgi:low temperature requirement protein LtrA
VLLGESIASLTSGLINVDWTLLTIATGMVGFSIIVMIWWIYFDSLNLLIESKRDKYGTGIIYSQLLVYMSFAILANTIRHAILNDLNLFDFRIMAISGMLLLYIGKQTAYAINVPKHNRNRIINYINSTYHCCSIVTFK